MNFDRKPEFFRRLLNHVPVKPGGSTSALWTKVRVLIMVMLMGAGGLALNNNYFELSKHIEIFTTLYREINTYYVDDVDPAKLMKTGIDAMLKSLDPYTDYIPESEIENFKFMTTGQYGGIGALISQSGETIVIADPYEGFPAQKADLRAGDQLLRINGEDVKGRNTEEVSKLLKGQPNTEVKILISRPGVLGPMEKVLVRQEIKVNSVAYSGMLNSTVGYVNLSAFRVDAGGEIQKAMYELKSKGMKSMVLDLRGIQAARWMRLCASADSSCPRDPKLWIPRVRSKSGTNRTIPWPILWMERCRWWCWSMVLRLRPQKSFQEFFKITIEPWWLVKRLLARGWFRRYVL